MADTQTRTARTDAPFTTVYFGVVLAVIGGLLLLTGWFGATAVTLSGVMVACTGMVIRALHRRP